MIELQSYFIKISDQKICIAIVFELIYEYKEGKNWKIKVFIKWWERSLMVNGWKD